MTEFASYVKVLVTFQGGMVTAGIVESQHSILLVQCFLLGFLWCVLWTSWPGLPQASFFSAWNITTVISALENQVFLHVLFRYMRCKLGIISVGKKTLDIGAIVFIQPQTGPAGCAEVHLLEISMPNSAQHLHFPLRPWRAMACSIC